jgi:hypothetical protein
VSTSVTGSVPVKSALMPIEPPIPPVVVVEVTDDVATIDEAPPAPAPPLPGPEVVVAAVVVLSGLASVVTVLVHARRRAAEPIKRIVFMGRG